MFWTTLLAGWLVMRLIVVVAPVVRVELTRAAVRMRPSERFAPARLVVRGSGMHAAVQLRSGHKAAHGFPPAVLPGPVPIPLPTAPAPYPLEPSPALVPTPERPLPLARFAPAAMGAAPPVPFGMPRRADKPRPAASLDAWVLWRGSGGGLGEGQGYGGSQMGAIGQFALGAGFSAYLRGDRALAGPSDQRIGAGLGLTPVAGMPIRLMVEGRAARSGGETRAMPAAMAVSTLPPIPFARDSLLESYAAAGWVGGREATPFFDLQAVVDRRIAGAGPTRLRFGGGVWAGGQKHAVRLDIGPRLRLDLPQGPGTGYLALDYRIRVAGNAAPASGPTLVVARSF